MLNAGDVLQARYRVAGLLGRGGMGAVYEATDERLGIQVALKECTFDKPEVMRQFEREARLLAQLRHSSLTRVYDHFVENGTAYLVMEFVPGEDLGAMLRDSGAFEVPRALKWADQLLAALEYLHTRQPPVIHRDIKPQNLKLTAGDEIILLDFGLAKGYASQTTLSDVSRSVFGYTPNYAPLEQIQGTEGTDARSDLYSLAATIYHLTTGNQPSGVLVRLGQTSDGLPDPLLPAEQLNPAVPAAVSAVLAKAMSISRDRRYSSASEMRDALSQAVRAGRATDTIPATTLPSGTTVPSRTTIPAAVASASATEHAGRKRRRGSAALLVVGTVILLILLAVSFGVLAWLRPDPIAEGTRENSVIPGTQTTVTEVVEPPSVERGTGMISLTGHTDGAKSVAWSADGALLASGAWDGTARVWRIASKPSLLTTITREGATINSVAFSPDGSTLAVGGYDSRGTTITFHDPRTGAAIREPLREPSGLVGQVLFSPDGTWLYATSSSVLFAWDLASGKEVLSISGNANPVLALSPDGSLLAMGSSNENVLRIFDARTGKPVRQIEGHEQGLLSVAFAPDGQFLATGSRDTYARVWNAMTGDLIRGMPHRDLDAPFSVAFDPRRDLLATGSYRTVRIWNAASGVPVSEMSTGEAGIVYDLEYSPDGSMLGAATSRGDILLITVAAGETPGG